jgi:cytochrome c-type biogenesis protein CcmH/NrfF
LLWLGPIGFLLIGIGLVVMLARHKKTTGPVPLDAKQQSRIQDILQQGEDE